MIEKKIDSAPLALALKNGGRKKCHELLRGKNRLKIRQLELAVLVVLDEVHLN